MSVALAYETPFTAIASATRRTMLDALRSRECTVGELVAATGVSQPAVSQHLRVLDEAGLVRKRSHGRFRYYRLAAEPLAEVHAWVRAYEQYWKEKLAALGRVLDEEP